MLKLTVFDLFLRLQLLNLAREMEFSDMSKLRWQLHGLYLSELEWSNKVHLRWEICVKPSNNYAAK